MKYILLFLALVCVGCSTTQETCAAYATEQECCTQ